MIERILYDYLEQGRDAIRATPSLLDGVFQPEGSRARVSDAELAKIKASFCPPALPVRIRHGFAASGTEIPCLSLVLRTDDLDTPLLGYFATDDDTDPREEVIGGLEQRTYGLISYGRTPDEAFWNYKIFKAIVIRSLRLLGQAGAQNIRWSGKDLELLRGVFPDDIYLRTLDLTLHVEEYVNLQWTPVHITGADVRRDDVGGGIVPYEV
jgi:hypothetical protein